MTNAILVVLSYSKRKKSTFKFRADFDFCGKGSFTKEIVNQNIINIAYNCSNKLGINSYNVN